MALSEYDKKYLTAQQQAQIQNLTNQWDNLNAQYQQAKASGDTALAEQLNKQKADVHTQAESVRATQGYLGGTAGDEYNVFAKAAPTYTAPSVTDYSSYLTDMYAAQKASALADIEAAYEKNKAAIDRAGAGLEGSYQNARNQTAGASEVAKRNNAQYAAAYGLNNGTGGQMELARNVTLQNNLNSINTQEAQSMADLELQRANAETEYNNAIAQANAQGNYELASALYQEKVRVQEALLNLQIQQYQTEYQAYRDSVGDSQWQQTNNQNMAQQNWQNLYNQTAYNDSQTQYKDSLTEQKQSDLADSGWAFLKMGAMPSAEMLAAMNMTAADAQTYITALKASQQSSESSGKTEASKPELTFSQVMSAIEDGMVTPAVKEAFAYYNGVSYDDYIDPKEAEPLPTGDPAKSPAFDLMNATSDLAENSGLGQLLNNNTQHTMGVYSVNVALSNMAKAGANATELRAALRDALATGLLTQAEYESLSDKYLPSGWRN